jgi:nucleobase:cation symporter-1, NCS1 family
MVLFWTHQEIVMQYQGPIPLEDIHAELIENGVPRNEQNMAQDKVFWAFFTPNINLTSWLFGIIAAQGLGFMWAVLAIALGNAVGALLSGLCGAIGPQSRLSSLQGSCFSFGQSGMKVPALLNWVNSAGWDAVNNVPSAAALVSFAVIYGVHAPFWIALAVLSIIQMVIAIYGHHFFQIVAKYMGYVLFAVFLFLGIRICLNVGFPSDSTGFSLKAFVLAVSVAAMGSAGYAPYAADYTRYLPSKVSRTSIVLKVFAGLFVSYMIMEIFGIITATVVKDLTPESLMVGLQSLAGVFAPLVLLVAGISVIPANAMNDNSAAYCLISSGIHIRRSLSAVIGATAGFVIAFYGQGHLSTIIEDTLLLLFYWIAPWTAIVLVHWFMMGLEEKKHARQDWTKGATIFCLVTIVTIALFSSNDLYTGPVAKALDGIDIGYYVGFVAAGFLYWLTFDAGKKTSKKR